MFSAKDKNGNIVYIDEAVKGEEYFCPICEKRVIQKLGDVREHHFAHISECTDLWQYDESEWHKEWKNKFPKENREVVVGEHRADVLINNLVVEFQHSKISIEEFRARNDYYREKGYNIVWLFDVSGECEKNKLVPGDKWNQYNWRGVPLPFREMLAKEEKCTLFFQLENKQGEEDYIIVNVTHSYGKFRTFFRRDALSVSEFIENLHIKAQQKAITNNLNTLANLWNPNLFKMIVKNNKGERFVIFGRDGKIQTNYSGDVVGGKIFVDKRGDMHFGEQKEIYGAKYKIWSIEKAYYKRA